MVSLALSSLCSCCSCSADSSLAARASASWELASSCSSSEAHCSARLQYAAETLSPCVLHDATKAAISHKIGACKAFVAADLAQSAIARMGSALEADYEARITGTWPRQLSVNFVSFSPRLRNGVFMKCRLTSSNRTATNFRETVTPWAG